MMEMAYCAVPCCAACKALRGRGRATSGGTTRLMADCLPLRELPTADESLRACYFNRGPDRPAVYQRRSVWLVGLAGLPVGAHCVHCTCHRLAPTLALQRSGQYWLAGVAPKLQHPCVHTCTRTQATHAACVCTEHVCTRQTTDRQGDTAIVILSARMQEHATPPPSCTLASARLHSAPHP